ncbi:MAG: TIGR03668 family PPOX class F420-dependent oxidoreductase [Actinomycetota bacterium]
MEEAHLRRVAGAPVGRLATVTEDGAPHVVPFCFALDTESGAIYWAVDHKPKSTAELKRLANLAAEPRVSFVVDEYADDWSQLWWVRVDGTSAVVVSESEREHALDLLAAKYTQYREVRPVGAVVRVDPTRFVGWAASPPAPGA